MPLEVSEITVQLAVRDGGGGSPAASGDGGGGACGQTELSAAQLDEIVARCTQRVLAALREHKAR